MTTARKTQVSLKETPYYHCIARCVRRAWLWGYDDYAGKDYSHRKDWIIERLKELSSIRAASRANVSNDLVRPTHFIISIKTTASGDGQSQARSRHQTCGGLSRTTSFNTVII